MNQYPLWKNLLFIFIFLVGVLYAVPNLYGEDPSIQISGMDQAAVDQTVSSKIEETLKKDNLRFQSTQLNEKTILIRFYDTDTQLKARDVIQQVLGANYTVALSLASATPTWFKSIGAEPMKLGLDLRGGIHFTLDVDVNSVVQQRTDGMVKNLSTEFREKNIRYTEIALQKNKGIVLKFKTSDAQNDAYSLIHRHYPELQITRGVEANNYQLIAQLSPQSINDMRQGIVDQTMTTLRHRVNELGIAEAVVQQQGLNRISVDLPGIQDTARAQQILGGTATLEFRMVDQEHDPQSALSGVPPVGSTLYTFNGRPVLLKNLVILTGNSITDATASYGEDGRPAVDITLGGGGESMFHRVTGQNVGKLMSIVYVETKSEMLNIEGQAVKTKHKVEKVISVATIKTALPSRFQINGLSDADEALNLALLLRAGALPATIDVVTTRTLGPKLGMENIQKGFLSVKVGLIIVIIFMAIYYRLFGLLADIALAINMILLVALLSILGMTLTLPGIAGIVLTVGMAVDANVLIFERIREELRNGMSVQASIYAGYERAFSTIVDANVATLIAALVLFGVGTGPVKGFAITLSLGLLTSMLSAIGITRALVNVIYGRRNVKTISIGI